MMGTMYPHKRELASQIDDKKEVDKQRLQAIKQAFKAYRQERNQRALPDEPDWAEPTDAELNWARTTMPGRATGHTVGWRVWATQWINRMEGEWPAEDWLVSLSDAELCDWLAGLQQRIIAARSEPDIRLLSNNGTEWIPGEPMIGVDRMEAPLAHGAGIYAHKECPITPANVTGCVFGKVGLWGTVIEHEEGFRARWAYPLELWCGDEQVATALQQTYGVPVHATRTENGQGDGRVWIGPNGGGKLAGRAAAGDHGGSTVWHSPTTGSVYVKDSSGRVLGKW